MSEINLGNWVEDTITHFTGTVVSRHEYIDGTVQFGVQPRVDKDGNYREVRFFDSGRLSIL